MNESAAHERPATAASTSEERTWALVAHLGAPAGLLLSAGLFGFAVPLVVYLAKRDESEFIRDQAAEALNFQISLIFWHVLVGVCLILFGIITLAIGFLAWIPVFMAVWLAELVLGIVAALRAHDGKRFRYPFTIRFIGS